MNKFYFVFAALAILLGGCHTQASKTSSDVAVGPWRDAREVNSTVETSKAGEPSKAQPVSAAKPEEKKADPVAKPEQKPEEAKSREAKAKPAPAPPPHREPLPERKPRVAAEPESAPQPASQPTAPQVQQPPRPATPPVYNTGQGPTFLVDGGYTVEHYTPMVHSWKPGWMLHVHNNTDRYVHISPAGAIPFYRKNGQGHLFASRIDADSGQPVILLRPGADAYWVVDQNMCPPNGARCKVTVQAAFYATTGPTSKRLGRTVKRILRFTGMDPTGQYWKLR